MQICNVGLDVRGIRLRCCQYWLVQKSCFEGLQGKHVIDYIQSLGDGGHNYQPPLDSTCWIHWEKAHVGTRYYLYARRILDEVDVFRAIQVQRYSVKNVRS